MRTILGIFYEIRALGQVTMGQSLHCSFVLFLSRAEKYDRE